MSSRRLTGRLAGALVPLFSIRSTASWGIGEIADLPVFADWVRRAGLAALQLLPVNEMAHGQSSPYSALSAMAIDPVYIAIREVPEFAAAGGEDALTPAQRETLAAARRAPSVPHRRIRELKNEVLRSLFDRFVEVDWRRGSARAAELDAYRHDQGWWLDDYALFRAIHEAHGRRYWIEWDAPLRERRPDAIARVWSAGEHEILYYTWLQWLAEEQWRRAHAQCRIEVLGDFPFMVSSDSADVWARQQEFRLDVSVGVPPDAFSETGQDWGLPAYRWDVHAATGYEWLRQRARRCADLFDGFRVDHLVGFYRTYVREPDGSACFTPADEAAQLAQGERLLELFKATGASIIAEDLGTVPDFVRESLTRLGVPGLKVMRWEREWEVDGQPFRMPADYPPASVAISGTHDTEPMAEWWTAAPAEERAAALEIPQLQAAGISPESPFSDAVRDALLAAVFAAGSDLVLLPVQDIFGWRDRINTPAVVNDENWSWVLPWPVDRLADQPEAVERAEAIDRLVRASGRMPR